MKKVGIIGSGVVAKTLAGGFINQGYEVMMGTTHPDNLKEVKGVTIGNVNNTVNFSDLLVLAIKGEGAIHYIADCQLSNKTIVDTTNPIASAPPVNGVLQFFTETNKSLGEQLQAAHSGAHFVKAFNSVGNANMINPDFNGVKPTMFICGNNDEAKQTVTSILDSFGWETADMGKIEACRAIEALCMLWCIPGFLQNSWTHAFKLLKR